MRQVGFFGALLGALILPGCDSGSLPVAPSGASITIVANPPSIALNGASTLTITALDGSGFPIATGTEIQLATDLGTIEELVRTNASGRANATLVATGRAGTANVTATSASVSATVSVSIDALTAPVASFGPPDVSGLTVIFTDTSTGSPTAWSWDFGDDRTSTRQNPVHNYRLAGTYTVTLTVSNPAGQSSASQFVTVASTAPVASFVIQRRNDLSVVFRDTSTGNPNSWSWDFGDGVGMSSEQDPEYTFLADGTYTVTLVASNGGGSSAPFTLNVTVP